MTRRMIRVGLAIAIALGVTAARAQVSTTKPSISIESVDSKLKAQWESGRWSDESVGMMKAVWNGFKAANGSGTASNETVNLGSLGVPNPGEPRIYIGQFGPKDAPEHGLLEVIEGDNKVWIKLQGHTIPAVTWNKCVLFATGDVVRSPTPAFGDKPHGALELLAICSIDKRFYLVNFNSLGPATELTKR